mgnify:FL=1
MHLALVPAQHQMLALAGGMTGHDSVFPLVEAWLAEESDRWHAFEKIRGRRDAGRYRSVIDFLLCEVVPSYRRPCFAFYETGERALHAVVSPRELLQLQARLMLFLAISYEAYTQKRAVSWRRAVELVDDVLAAA